MSENKPYYGRDRRDSRDRRSSRPADHRRSHTILPPASILDSYEELLPGSVEILFEMAEREQKNRHDREQAQFAAHIRSHRIGQFFGFVVSLSIVISVSYLALQGQEDTAITLALSGFGALALASLISSRSRKKGRTPHHHNRTQNDQRPRNNSRYNKQDENPKAAA